MLEPNIAVESPFFIFFPERSGSTFLCHLLNAHSDVFCEHEVFSIKKNPDTKRFEPRIKSDSEKVQHLEKIYSYQNVKASGFKFKFSAQYEAYPEVYRFFMRNVCSIKQIFLYRKNLLKTAISRQNLNRLSQAGERHFLNGDNHQDLGKLELDLQRALGYIRRHSQELELFRKMSEIFEYRIEVTYEDLYQNTSGTLNRIFEFLGVEKTHQTYESPIRKITEDRLEDAIANYDEMIEFFEPTRFSKYLEV